MSVNKVILTSVVALLASTFSFGQGRSKDANDNLEVWTKRVSRVVMLGDSFYVPKPKLKNENEEPTLAQIIFKAVIKGKIPVYSTPDTKFAYPPLTRKAAEELIYVVTPDTVEFEDVDGYMVKKVIKQDISYERIRKYKILEEWTYDIKKAKTTIQIVGIAPYTPPDIMSKSGKMIGDYPLFWVKYEDIKDILISYQQSHPDFNIPLSVWNSYFTETE